MRKRAHGALIALLLLIGSVATVQAGSPTMGILLNTAAAYDGYTLIEKVRRSEDLGRLPVLVLSSRTGEDNQRRARRAGADTFLFKPVNRRVILTRIRQALRGEGTRPSAFKGESR